MTMTDTIDKAVWLEDMGRVHNVASVLEQLYGGIWTGGMLFRDTTQGGFLLVACFDPDTYIALGTPWETLFPPAHLRAVTFEEAGAHWHRYRPWLAGDIISTLRSLRLLPKERPAQSERDPPLAAVRAERDPPEGLP
jgi:hypothetical protein